VMNSKEPNELWLWLKICIVLNGGFA